MTEAAEVAAMAVVEIFGELFEGWHQALFAIALWDRCLVVLGALSDHEGMGYLNVTSSPVPLP